MNEKLNHFVSPTECTSTSWNENANLYTYECESSTLHIWIRVTDFTFTSWNEIANVHIWMWATNFKYMNASLHSLVETKLPTFTSMNASHEVFTYMNTSHRFHIHKLKWNCPPLYLWVRVTNFTYMNASLHLLGEAKLPIFTYMNARHRFFIHVVKQNCVIDSNLYT